MMAEEIADPLEARRKRHWYGPRCSCCETPGTPRAGGRAPAKSPKDTYLKDLGWGTSGVTR